ncbi:MAG: BatD family protein [Gemmatimonadetes bacterium]|nr:BatD family protein [Gemmatimonadota bacterium]
MIALALGLMLVAQQARGPEVMLAVDRDRVAPGDVITLTIRVVSDLSDPIRVDLPTLGGVELESRSERSDVSTGDKAGRSTWIELKLRAVTPGEWRLGPVNVRQGIAYAQGDAVAITIEGGTPAAVTASLSDRLSRIIQRAPPPSALGAAGISVALSDERVVVGQQVDVVTLAWFERETRQRLRRAPTVEPPQIEGVWSYPQLVPGGIAATRQVGGKWYDLFVLHQVAFPLTPGRFAVSPARLTYHLPLAYQFFSQEERYELASDPTSFAALALPDAGRPPGFAGAVGHGLSVTRTLTPASGRQGEAFTAEIVVRGEGNVALWPEPGVRWPAGVRVYPEAAEERPASNGGRFGGRKTFHFLLIPDSAGTLSVPALGYPYFDPESGTYQQVTVPPGVMVVAPRGERVVARAEPPPIRLDLRVPLGRRVQAALPVAAWWLLALAPLLVWLVPRLPRLRRPRGPAPAPRAETLGLAHRRVVRALADVGERGEDAGRLAALKARLDAARFSRDAVAGEHALLTEVEQVLASHPDGGSPSRRRWRQRAGLIVVLGILGAGAGAAQAGPEQLYEAGAYRAAAVGFLRRASLGRDVTAHWFNLGAAAFRGGSDAAALVAYVRAARLSPRDGGVRRALVLLPPADSRAADDLWVAPVTPEELWLVGLVTWLAGWAGILVTRTWRGRWVVLLAGGATLVAAGEGLAWRYARPLAVVAENQQLRLSPHELAPAVGEAALLSTVRLGPARGAWVQVELPGGQRGWAEAAGLVPLDAPRIP